MPTSPVVFRSHARPTRHEQRQAYDAKRKAEKPWRAWYKLAIWKAIRARQLADDPLCTRCTAEGVTIAATTVHHVHAHKGDWQKFISGPFESLCDTHHNREAQAEERQGEGGSKSLGTFRRGPVG